MELLKKIIAQVYQKNPIQHSDIMELFTKYGIYHAKMYKDGNQEYLALMSQNFFDLKTPIVYIHSDTYSCEHLSNSQLDLAIKMIGKEHGLFIYYSKEDNKIDALLKGINTRKLQTKTDKKYKTGAKAGLKAYKRVLHPKLHTQRLKSLTHAACIK